jgi:hypothetical protein
MTLVFDTLELYYLRNILSQQIYDMTDTNDVPFSDIEFVKSIRDKIAVELLGREGQISFSNTTYKKLE